MIIVQISDLHIDRDDASGANAARLDACLADIVRLRTVPAAVLLTGDLTEHGAASETPRREPPAYQVHAWRDGTLVTHTVGALRRE